MTVYANVLQRTYLIKVGSKKGTGYLHVQNGHSFIITAKHIFEGQRSDRIEVFHAETWKSGEVEARFAKYGVDLAVVLVPGLKATATNATLKVEEVLFGQDVFAVGFPLALYQRGTADEPDTLLPFLSKGCVSAAKPHEGFYISGQIDEGYSGGPVSLSATQHKPPVIIGFVSHNLRRKVSQELDSGQKVIVSQPANLIYAVSSQIAQKIIDEWCKDLGGSK